MELTIKLKLVTTERQTYISWFSDTKVQHYFDISVYRKTTLTIKTFCVSKKDIVKSRQIKLSKRISNEKDCTKKTK